MNDKTEQLMVIKVGGAKVRERGDLADLDFFLGRQLERGNRVVLVHGGGPEVGEVQRLMGATVARHDGQRVTGPRTLAAAVMVLCGLVNKRIVSWLVEDGLPALGVSGVDGGLLRSGFLDHERLGRVGTPPRVDAGALQRLLEAGFLPVLAPVGLGPDGAPVNINADTVAQAVATALSAVSLDFITDVRGVVTGSGEVARRLYADEARALLSCADVSGGMVPKLRAAAVAVEAGVRRARIGDLRGMRSDSATEVVA